MRDRKTAVLSSGGLDSSIMLVELAAIGREVYPLYVRSGLPWEKREQEFLERFVERLDNPRIQEVQTLELPTSDVYQDSWYRKRGIPDYDAADEAIEIPGRNVLLLAKASVWCKVHSVEELALGTLLGNPFPDATLEFTGWMERALGLGLALPLTIVQPMAGVTKAEVIRRGRDLPLELTLSCARPEGRRHCGACGKCRERIEGFRAAGVEDPTPYLSQSPCVSLV